MFLDYHITQWVLFEHNALYVRTFLQTFRCVRHQTSLEAVDYDTMKKLRHWIAYFDTLWEIDPVQNKVYLWIPEMYLKEARAEFAKYFALTSEIV